MRELKFCCHSVVIQRACVSLSHGPGSPRPMPRAMMKMYRERRRRFAVDSHSLSIDVIRGGDGTGGGGRGGGVVWRRKPPGLVWRDNVRPSTAREPLKRRCWCVRYRRVVFPRKCFERHLIRDIIYVVECRCLYAGLQFLSIFRLPSLMFHLFSRQRREMRDRVRWLVDASECA